MKNRNKQGGASRYILITISLLLLFSISLFSFAACNNNVDVASVSVVEETIPQNVRVSDFDITKVSLRVVDSKGAESVIFVSPTMLTTDSKNKLKTGGEHSITLMYYGKPVSFTVNLFDDDAELVTIIFKDKYNNEITRKIAVKGQSVTPPPHPIIEGMKADGWIDSDNNPVSFSSVNESMEVMARYTEDLRMYEVTFKDYQGNIIEVMSVAHGSRLPGTPSYVAPEGIAGWDWYYGNNELDIDKLEVKQNLIITMKAQTVKHVVRFVFIDVDTNEKIILSEEQVDYGKAAKSAEEARQLISDYGYEFINWNTNAFNNVRIDLEVVAQVQPVSYTVVFQYSDGSIIETVAVRHGKNVVEPPKTIMQVPEGYKFTGNWAGGSLTNVTQNLTLTPVFELKEYEITIYDENKPPQIYFMKHGDTITAENLHEFNNRNDGSILVGLYNDAALTQAVELPYSINMQKSFYTKWLDSNNGNAELIYSEVSGEGDDAYRKVIGYTGNDSVIYIPDNYNSVPVKGIEANVFKGKNITKVYLGQNIKEIGDFAFADTKLAGELNLPQGIITIGKSAFANCADLTTINIPATVTDIGEGAFEDCVALTKVTFENGISITEIKANTFKGCLKLSDFVLPQSVTEIGDSAFEQAGLAVINLENIVSVGAAAFKDCANLADITANGALATIKEYAFANTALNALSLLAIEEIQSYAFAGSKLVSIVLGSKLETVKEYTFMDCAFLNSVSFAVETVDDAVEGTLYIEDYAFLNCSSLLSIALPLTLESVTVNAFAGALKLSAISIDDASAEFSSIDGVLYDKDQSRLVIYPAGRICQEYETAEGLTEISAHAFKDAIIAKLIVSDTVNAIGDGAFDSKGIAVIEFLGDVPENIGDGLFNSALRKLYVQADYVDGYRAVPQFAQAEEAVTEQESFYDAQSGLSYIIVNGRVRIFAADRQATEITVPAMIDGGMVTHILPYAFADCDRLERVNVLAKLSVLGEYAFKGCYNLTQIIFSEIQKEEAGEEASIINLNAFEDTPWYKQSELVIIADTAMEYKFVVDEEGNNIVKKSLNIPSGVTALDASLFDNEAGKLLESVTLPQTLEIIRDYAFKGTAITEIAIPAQVYAIGEGAFENCERLESVVFYGDSITEISEKAFKNCASLKSVALPANVRFIRSQAFMDCSSLEEMIFPGSLIQIEDSAFENCQNLAVIKLPSRLGVGLPIEINALGDRVFAGCDNLIYVRVWNVNPPRIGQDVFESSAFIYVESSDGDIIAAYKTQWSEYAAQIKDQKDSPVISFIANEDDNGEIIPNMENIRVDSIKSAVLKQAPQLPEVSGYIFVCWTYQDSLGQWLPVEYPFLAPVSVTLKAKWVKNDEGSLSDNDVVFNSVMGGYILTSYNGSDVKVVIPAEYKGIPIIAIGENAFADNLNITDIIFASDSRITRIAPQAFARMTKLVSIILPSSLIDLEDQAFADCENLEYIYIPAGVKGIGPNAFAGCLKLEIEFEQGSQLRYAYIDSFQDTKWYVDQKANEMNNYIIAGRLAIEYVGGENQNLISIPDGVIALRSELFMGNNNIVTLELNSDIEFIGDRCFYNCQNLRYVQFGVSENSKISYVGKDAFTGTLWRREKELQEEFVVVGTILVRYEGYEEEIEIDNYITVIDAGAFAYKSLRKITLPSSLKVIGERAFYECANLEEIVIPSQVTSIGKEAFANNTSLRSVIFNGNSLKSIGDRAFYGCQNLGTSISAPQTVLPSSLETLGTGVFEGCVALTDINMQNSKITALPTRAFYDCRSLNSVSLPATLLTIGDNAFSGCTVLENLTVPANSALERISENALTDTLWYMRNAPEGEEEIYIYLGSILLKYRQRPGSSVKSNTIVPSQIKYIAAHAFENSNIASVTLPEGLLIISDYAFAGCIYLTHLVLPNSVISIGINSFANCTGLETAELGMGLTTVEASAFRGCHNLTKLIINRMAYEQLTNEQFIGLSNAISNNTLSEFLALNPDIFRGTDLKNANALQDTSNYLRIYVVRDSTNINIEIYKHAWNAVRNRIYNSGEIPTVSFVNISGATELYPINTEYLTEDDLQVVFKDHTLLGWEEVSSPQDENGVKVNIPLKVIKDTLLRPIWLSNNRPVNDTQLGFTYAPNAAQNAYLINGYNSESDTLIIASKVNNLPLIGINSGVFNETNTANVKRIIITEGDNLGIFDINPFRMFPNLESITVNGTASNYVSVDGVLYTSDMSTIVSYPRSRKLNGALVTSYELPNTVHTIAGYAFAGSALTSLHIPDSVKIIGEGAFNGNYRMGDNGEYIGLRTITFGENSEIQEIAYGAFDETAWYLSLNTEFKVAGSYLLNYNGYNTSVTVPGNIKTIGIRAFENNNRNNIVKLTIPQTVVRINQDAFINCSNIETIIFSGDSSLMYAANDVFKDTSWLTMNPNEFVIAGNILVAYYSGRDYLVLPDEVKVIGYNAFNNAKFSQITLHNQLERIDESAFFGCDDLQSITIPASVQSIGDSTFFSCLKLTSVTFAAGSNLRLIGNNAFAYTSVMSIDIPDNVLKIGNNAFEYCLELEEVNISPNSSLEEIGSAAFKNAKSLKGIYIPDGLSEIKASTFEGCDSLLTVEFSNNNKNLKKIGENAFRNCILLGSKLEGRDNLLTVQLPYGVVHIEAGAFYGCRSMYGIKMQEQIKSIGINAFYNCTNLSNITIRTSQPPAIDASSFNFSAHPKVRIYVNFSSGDSVLEAYRIAWGGEKVASTANILVRGNNNLPLVQFYEITSDGDEVHLAERDMNAELLSATLLPSFSHPTKGMAIGFYKNKNWDPATQICTSTRPFEVVQDAVLKLYVRWENN